MNKNKKLDVEERSVTDRIPLGKTSLMSGVRKRNTF